jgi:hypothetical protein
LFSYLEKSNLSVLLNCYFYRYNTENIYRPGVADEMVKKAHALLKVNFMKKYLLNRFKKFETILEIVFE